MTPHPLSQCAHIGKLKKQIERDLKDEWYVTTNISALPGRPVGIGAIIHCSLAKYVTDCAIAPTNNNQVNKTDWEAAINGRILRLQFYPPGSSFHVGNHCCIPTRHQERVAAMASET